MDERNIDDDRLHHSILVPAEGIGRARESSAAAVSPIRIVSVRDPSWPEANS